MFGVEKAVSVVANGAKSHIAPRYSEISGRHCQISV